MMLAWLILGLGGAYAGLLAYIYITQDRRFFPCNGAAFGDFEGLRQLSGRAVTVSREGQALRYYFVPSQGASRGLFLLFHGNRDGARERFDFAQNLVGQGVDVMLAEYPGYAGGIEAASEALLLRNALAMADEAAGLCGSLPLVLAGESLGTAMATYCAYKRSCAGLALVTPYPTMADVAGSRYPWLPVGPFVRHRFPAWRWAAQVGVPVLVIHGTEDATIPYAMGQAQSKRFAHSSFVSLPGRGHADLRDAVPEQFWGPLGDFVKGLL